MTIVTMDEMTLERFDHENGWSATIVYATPKGAVRGGAKAYIDAEMLILTGPDGQVGTLDKHQTRGLLMQRMEAQRGN